MAIQTLDEGDFGGKCVLVRVDFNVPVEESVVQDDARIQAALPTIKTLRQAGARVILMSHLGRPGGKREAAFTLEPVAKRLEELLATPVRFAKDCIGKPAEEQVARLRDGEVLLLENVRFHAGETTNDPQFATQLASLGDLFVNDAFGTAHREHASNVGVASRLPSFAGHLIGKELQALGDALDDPERPFAAVLGGAKVSDKLTIVERLIEKVDRLVIGGGMAFTFLKAEGHEVGGSLVEDEHLELAGSLLGRARARGVEVLLPVDVEAADRFDKGATHRAVKVGSMRPEWMGLDIGPLTAEAFADAIEKSKTVLWNGPMGVFEWEPFQFGTRAVAQAAANCPGTVVLGGGDSAAAAKKFGITHKVAHVSTGGGASLKFLEGATLPGIAALEASVAVA